MGEVHQSALDACRCAIRLFLRLALTRPFSEFLSRLWPFVEDRFVNRLELLELKPYQRIQEDYRLLLEVGGKLTVFGLVEEDHLDFLALADRWYFGNIIFLLKQAAPKLDNDKTWPFEQYPKALTTLVVELEELGVHQTNELVMLRYQPQKPAGLTSIIIRERAIPCRRPVCVIHVALYAITTVTIPAFHPRTGDSTCAAIA